MGNRLANSNVKDLRWFIGKTSRRQTAVVVKTGYAGRAVEVPADSVLGQWSPVEQSVLRGFFDVVDDVNVDRAFGWFELEASLLLERGKEIGERRVSA
jgi:hypothetical protein